jgi:hypothetical protein
MGFREKGKSRGVFGKNFIFFPPHGLEQRG